MIDKQKVIEDMARSAIEYANNRMDEINKMIFEQLDKGRRNDFDG